VLTFDPDRLRRRKDGLPTPVPPTTSTPPSVTPAGGNVGSPVGVGTAGNAQAVREAEPSPVEDARLAPQALEEPNPRRYGLWFGVAFAIVATAVTAFALLLLR
jgi:hypothetical protein